MNPCLLIPNYNHGSTMGEVLASLEPLGLPCIVVDDGSSGSTKETLQELGGRFPWVHLETFSKNRGKGAALRTGYRVADGLGFTHTLQLDADGQHDASDLPGLLEAAEHQPEALVLGVPTFHNAPRSRLFGRRISCFWVWVETCTLEIRDPLCGLRCVPLKPTLRVLRRIPCGDRMDFDPEIVVRLFWEGTPIVNVPCRVRYSADGISHFDLVWDNVRMTWLHTRLFFGMTTRLPMLIHRRMRRDP